MANDELLRSILNHTLLGILNVSSLCVLDEKSVAPTNSSLIVPRIAHSPPHRARQLPAGIISWFVVCTNTDEHSALYLSASHRRVNCPLVSQLTELSGLSICICFSDTKLVSSHYIELLRLNLYN